MPYSPHTDSTRRRMLATIGVESFEDLIGAIPESVRSKHLPDIPVARSESEIDQEMQDLASQNAASPAYISFLGGGLYDHHVPAAVDHVGGRSEFHTAYTPYQPEVAQGTLQATYEFQSMIRRLTAMDVAQASLYDGASAVAEAVLLAMAQTRRKGIVFAGTLNPRYRDVVETYLTAQSAIITEAISSDGTTDFAALNAQCNDTTACVVMPSPNYFGSLDDWQRGAALAHKAGALLIAVFHPISLGAIKPPGECDADIAVGEGQCLGNPLAYGGPLLGMMAVRRKFIRRLPGRIVGRSVDARGVTAYVMTLQTREQHIRREKATSNICTAQALLATRASIYMALLGKQGIVKLATTCMERAHYLAESIANIPGLSVPLGPAFFNEFVVATETKACDLLAHLRDRGILGGIDLAAKFPDQANQLLVCVTEKHSRATLDRFVQALKEFPSGSTHRQSSRPQRQEQHAGERA